jgi:hypothetical protein
MSVCQYKFNNGTICGTRTQSLYCAGHAQIKKDQDHYEQIAALAADNARLREALAAMVTATSNFNVGLAEARELADAALAAYKQAQGK